MLNYEEHRSYSTKVIVRNAHRPEKSTVMAIFVQVLDENDTPQLSFQPALPSSSALGVDIPETSATGTVIGQVVIFDEDADDVCTAQLLGRSLTFSLEQVNSTAYNIVLVKALDYETRSLYPLNITATDLAGATSTLVLDATIVDVNEAPTFQKTSISLLKKTRPPGQLRPQGLDHVDCAPE